MSVTYGLECPPNVWNATCSDLSEQANPTVSARAAHSNEQATPAVSAKYSQAQLNEDRQQRQAINRMKARCGGATDEKICKAVKAPKGSGIGNKCSWDKKQKKCSISDSTLFAKTMCNFL